MSAARVAALPRTFPPEPAPRPRRGDPEQTRARLVAAAGERFNAVGYHGTDSNRIARAAGYSPGTFYKHFSTKKEILLAVYDEWLAREWRAVAAAALQPGPPRRRAGRIVDLFLAHHARWHRFRASLRALAEADEAVRTHYRAQRRSQLRLLASLRKAQGLAPISRERRALLLFTLERAGDALAGDEASALGLRRSRLRPLLVALVAEHLSGDSPR